MGLREQIEAKQRRTARHPVLVGDPSAALVEAQTTAAALAVHKATVENKRAEGKRPTKADREREQQLQADHDRAKQRLASAVVEVELQSLPDDEWETLFAGVQPDDDGELDLRPIHAVALAASCTDPELQDADWWAEQLAKPHWSLGDRAAISKTLLDLNWLAPRFGALGKG